MSGLYGNYSDYEAYIEILNPSDGTSSSMSGAQQFICEPPGAQLQLALASVYDGSVRVGLKILFSLITTNQP